MSRKARKVKKSGSAGSRASSPSVVVYDQQKRPLREWDRATQFLSVFAISGFVSEQTAQGDVVKSRPASVLLVGGPGSGKTELVERFRRSRWLSYHDDMTARPLYGLLRKAEQGLLTHIAAPEFNKWFQRKVSVVENCLGLMSQAMEEGVHNVDVGPSIKLRYDYARLGLIGGMTPRTMERRRYLMEDMGFLTRVSAFDWQLPRGERDEVLRRINHGIGDDVEPVDLPKPEQGTAVIAWDAKLGETVLKLVRERWPANDLRVFKRFKTLLLARSYLTGLSRVTGDVWDWLRSYDDYWDRMIVSEE